MLTEQLALAEAQLRRTEEAIAKGYHGADRWHEHHLDTVQRLQSLVTILDDPSIPEGSPIRLANRREFSPIRLAIQDRIQLEGPDSSVFEKLQTHLEGNDGATADGREHPIDL